MGFPVVVLVMVASSSSSGSSSGSSSSGSRPRVDNKNVGKNYRPAGSGGGSGGAPRVDNATVGKNYRPRSSGGGVKTASVSTQTAASPAPNFSTLSGREVSVTPQGAPSPNFSDLYRGPVYVPAPQGPQYSTNAPNFSRRDGAAVYVSPQSSQAAGVPRRDGFISSESQQSANLTRLFAVSDFVAAREASFKVRQENYGRTMSFLSFGGGVPYEERSVAGKSGQVVATIITAPVYGPAVVADASGQAGLKSFLYTGALLTPETKQAAKDELRGNTAVFGKVYSDPATYAYALSGGVAKGYADFNIARANPKTVTFTAKGGAVSDVTLGKSSVSGSGRVLGEATATYKYGPFNMFSKVETVPAQAGVVFSGNKLAGKGGKYTIDAQGKSITEIGGKQYEADVSYNGVYSSGAGRVQLVSGNTVFMSKTGPGVPAGVLGERTAPGQSSVFTKDARGNYVLSSTTGARGFQEGGVVSRYTFEPSKNFYDVGRTSDHNTPHVILYKPGSKVGYVRPAVKEGGPMQQVSGTSYRSNKVGGFAITADKTNNVFMNENRQAFGDVIKPHEMGHKAHTFILRKDEVWRFVAGESKKENLKLRGEIIALTEKQKIGSEDFFRHYSPKDRGFEYFAELYRARKTDPAGFAKLAPTFEKKFASIDPHYIAMAEKPYVFTKRDSSFVGSVEQVAAPGRGLGLRDVDAGFRTLEGAGLVSRSVEPRPFVSDVVRGVVRSRSGRAQLFEVPNESVFSPSRTVGRGVRPGRGVTFEGLPMGGVRPSQVSFPAIVVLPDSRARNVLAQRPGQDVTPKPISDVLPWQKPREVFDQERIPQQDVTPEFSPRQNPAQRPRPLPPPPVFVDVPPPVVPDLPPPPVVLPFGGGGSSGGGASLRDVRFKTAYNPSIAGGLFELKGSRKQAVAASISGLGVRPLKIV